MAYVERHYTKPGACCGHSYRKHRDKTKDQPARCLAAGDCPCAGWKPQPGDRLRYRCRWRDPAGREKAKTFAKAVQAEQWKTSIEHAKHAGAYVDPAAGRERFGPWAERWYNTTAHLKASTRRDYRALLDHQVLPAFGAATLAGIDTLAVREWVAKLVAGGLSAKRARKAYQVLAQILERAVEGGKLVRNPAALKSRDLPKTQRREMHFLDVGQVELIADAITPHFRALVLTAAYTGLRPCELAALRVGHVDLLRGTIRVARAAVEVGGKLVEDDVKTYEARTVRLPRSVADALGASLAARGPLGQDALVFTATLGGSLRENAFVTRHFKPAIAAANTCIAAMPAESRQAPIPGALRFYDLRHTCASLMIREGFSVKAVQAQMGHATAAMTLDTYGHLFPSELDAVGERLDRMRTAGLATLPADPTPNRVRTENVLKSAPQRSSAGQRR